MARTLKTNSWNFFAVLCCGVLLVFMFSIDGVHASTSNSSGVVSSGGQLNNDDGEGTAEKGMQPFFDMVKSFLGVVQPEKLTDQPWLNLSGIVKGGNFHSDEINDWKNWCKYLVGFLVCAAVGLLFFLVMPITGLVFCCCRLCGKCGARPKPHDPKHARCKRTTFCTLLLVLNTMALAGVVCTFMSNQILFDKMKNENDKGPVGKLVNTVDYVNQYANTTVEEVTVAVLDRFVKTSKDIINDIRGSAEDAIDDVLKRLNAISILDQFKTVGAGVTKTKDALQDVANQLHSLSSQGTQLAGNLSEISSRIDVVCPTPSACPGYDSSKYAISANFSQLDTLGKEADNVAKAANLSETVKEAEESINSTKVTASDSINNSISSSTSSVNDLETSINDGVGKFRSNVQDSVTTELDKVRSDLKGAQDDITKYSKFVWYAGIGISCALLLIVVLYYVGILFGLCGERPGFGAQCCNTGTGSNFLMAGVGITFLLTWLIMLVCVILFMLGGPLYTELCRYFDDHRPRELKPFSDAVMNGVEFQKSLFKGKDVHLDLVTILEGCENNKAIYEVLQLDNMVNISQYTDMSKVRQALDNLKRDNFHIPNVTVVTPRMTQSIRDFADAGLRNITFDDYYTELNKSLTAGELPDLARQLRTIASSTAAQGTNPTVLNDAADQLDNLQTTLVVPMQQAKVSLRRSLNYVKQQAESGLKDSTDALISNLTAVEANFNSQKDSLVNDELTTLINRVLNQVEGIVQAMLTDVNHNIGKCRPVYDGFYSATDAACVVVLEPLNGLWFSIGWCLFFFIPSLIFAVKLAGLYRREHEERDFDDPNFSLYEEGKQDSIPLASRHQPGRASPSHRQDSGVANHGSEAESQMGYDYPNYKGGAVNAGYHHDGYMGPTAESSPPPYGSHDDHGAMNGNAKGRDHRHPY